MLAIEVEFLTGVSVAATPHRRKEPEWPPHPDRLFQALVAAWGRNEEPQDDERAALEWLEELDMEELDVSAPHAHRRDIAPVFVPPNDARTTRDPKKSVLVVPALRTNRQPRTFAAVVPAAQRPIVRYLWRQADGLEQHRAALNRLAAEVTYLGHSHTLVRVALLDGGSACDGWDDGWMGANRVALRTPYPGRLRYLQQHLRSGLPGPPNPSLAVQQFSPPRSEEPPHTLFDPEAVIVLADDGGFVPALDAFPLVAKRFRDALMRTADEVGLAIPTILSGHDAEGSPAETPHLAVVPLADVGWRYSQGRLMGIALLWPRLVADEDRSAVLRILAAFLRDGCGELHFGQAGSWRVALDVAANRMSLRAERYARTTRRWGTVLPLVLDRHPKKKPNRDMAAIVAQACLNVGLPEQVIDGLRVDPQQYSPISGGPSVRAVAELLANDSPYRGRPMRHVALTFAEPVRGPLVIGAGRYRGLGLCLPLDEEPQP